MITKAQAVELTRINKLRLEKKVKENKLAAAKAKKEKVRQLAEERKKKIAGLVEYCEERIKDAAVGGQTKCSIQIGHPDNNPEDEIKEVMSYLKEFNPEMKITAVEFDNFGDLMAELTRVERSWTEPRVNIELHW